MKEIQLTHEPYGHMLNSTQAFSPDDQWIVYDTRNDQTHIGRTCCIEKVNRRTGEVVRLYSVPGQSLHGPGVGAPAWHPHADRLIFIHGLLNCSASRPYGFTRRFGALWDAQSPDTVVPAEARAVNPPLIAGALRGGTHAHSWSGDGEWISFTYNDFILERLEHTSGSEVKDLRTIGVMSPVAAVSVASEDAENFSGRYFTVVAATVTENPRPGTDDIDKAFDECWIGENGYIRSDGSRQKRAIAFQGNVRTEAGEVLTEVFVTDIPEDITTPRAGMPLEGSSSLRPAVPQGLVQRRLTFTADRTFPGVQGPRCWLRSSPDGSEIYFLMKDDEGIVQVHSVPVLGGAIRQVTRLPASVQSQFNVSPDGGYIALIADNSVWICDVRNAGTRRLTPRSDDATAPVSTVLWNKRGDCLVYNRYVHGSDGRWLQIFRLDLN